MWVDERKRARLRNILLFLLLLLAVGGLLAAMFAAKQRINQEDELLSEVSSSQQQEQNDARQENLEAIQLAYEEDLQALGQYMPGIVCWGDSLTVGSSGNMSYPYILQKYINTYLCDIYDFRSSVENAEDYARLKWDDYTVSIPVVNMGGGQENSATVLGRSGVRPFVVGADFVIPAGTESVSITLTSSDGSEVMPLTAGSTGVNPVTIAGVQGTLFLENSPSGGARSYSFTRLEGGVETPVSAGTEITTACAGEYRDYIHIVWIGTYGRFTTPEQLVSDTKELLSRQSANSDRFLVIGPCTYNGTWSPNYIYSLDAIDSAMLQAFGSRYVNVRKYLIEDGLRDANITPSKYDSTNMSHGYVPDSFRSAAGGADLNGAAYDLIGKLVYERMERLGYFAEIRSELNLDQTTQEIIKKDPQYFEKMLRTN